MSTNPNPNLENKESPTSQCEANEKVLTQHDCQGPQNPGTMDRHNTFDNTCVDSKAHEAMQLNLQRNLQDIRNEHSGINPVAPNP